MVKFLKNNGLSIPKAVLTLLICAAGFLSIIYVKLTTNATFSYFYCLATVGFALLPPALTLVFRWRMNIIFYVFFSLYTLGPLLGAVYNFYYLTSWWDDLLHAMAGVVFAVVGAYFCVALNKNQGTSYLLVAIFGVLFSIGIAVFWEFYEYASDRLLGSDMQADTIIGSLATKLDGTQGEVIIFDNITEVLINGQPLGVSGYLDIGLIDTMTDIIVETLGALVYFVYAVVDRGRHPLISRFERVKGQRAARG